MIELPYDDDACLDKLWRSRHSPDGVHAECRNCGRARFYRIRTRPVYACDCGFQIRPTAGTIFHRSHVPLSAWFYAIDRVAEGISAKQLQRDLGVTYRTAWGMAAKIKGRARDSRADDARLKDWAGHKAKRVEAVKQARQRGKTVYQIAADLGVAHQTVAIDLACHAESGLARASSWELHTLREATQHESDPAEFLAVKQEERRYRQHRSFVRRRTRQLASLSPSRAGLVSLDHHLDEFHSRHETVASATSLDPFVVLTGTHADHMNEVLGDLSMEDVARMDEWQLQTLRERLLEAGITPSSVQRSERDRLRNVAPHRGDGPAPMKQRMSSRHRGRREASSLMSQRGKKFNRRKTKYRDAA